MVTFMDFIISEVGFSSTCFGWFAVISLVLYHWLAPAKTGIAIAAITIVMVPVPPLKKFVITCHGVYAMFSPKKFCIFSMTCTAFTPPSTAASPAAGNAPIKVCHCCAVNLYNRSITVFTLVKSNLSPVILHACASCVNTSCV